MAAKYPGVTRRHVAHGIPPSGLGSSGRTMPSPVLLPVTMGRPLTAEACRT